MRQTHKIFRCFTKQGRSALNVVYGNFANGRFVVVKGECACVTVEGDGRDLSLLLSESIDCIITDHPWQDRVANKGGNRSFSDYNCFQYTLRDFQEKARVLKPGCFLAEVIPAENESNYEYLYQIKQMAAESGLQYYCKVAWKKGKFVGNTGRKAKNTEEIMIFSKGKARALREDVKRSQRTGGQVLMSGTKGMLPAMFDVAPVPKAERIHQSQLPVALCKELLSYLTLEGEIILDQFAGSGTVGAAACQNGRNAILIECDHEMTERINTRIKHVMDGLDMEGQPLRDKCLDCN